MDSLSTRIANLSPAKRALLEQRLRQQREGQSAYQEDCPRRLCQTSAPLTMAQQRLWVLNQLEPESAFYNMFRCSNLKGELNIAVLTRAITCVIERHESLRTQYVVVEDQPQQVISRDWSFDLPIVDLSQQASAEQGSSLRRLIEQKSKRPFNLSSDLMLRATLFRLGTHHHLLLTVIHHIAGDGWSNSIFAHELTALYQHLLAGQPIPLPELPIQYSDFAIWQQGYLSGERLQEQVKFWSQQLQAAPVLELPTDFPRPPIQTYNGESQTFCLSADLTQVLKELSLESGTTLFIVLLSAWAILLGRYSQQEDIVIGSPIANRNRVEIEPLIGLFLNTLALRIDLSGNPTYRELLKRLKQRALDAYAHQDVPFEKLLEDLKPERDASRSPWFQVMFALQNFPKETLTFSGLEMTPYRLKNTTAKFDLTIGMAEQDAQLQGNIAYNTDLFKAETITRMVEHFQVLLAAIVASPDQPVATLPILPETERRKLLVDWNNTLTGYPNNHGIHRLFEEQAARTPEAVAVVCEHQQFTYQALDQQANRWAHYLRTRGVGPDVPVGLYLERSLEALVATLAILKAGGAYVPLEPGYPTERLAYILEDTRPPLLLTTQALATHLPAHAAQTICLDVPPADCLSYPTTSPPSRTTADSLAYIMYTSGSTGRPKGVCVTPRGVVRLSCHPTYLDIQPSDTFLQLAPMAFDAATFEIWGALLNGARLVLLPNSRPTLAELADAINTHQVSILWLTAGLFHLMVEQNIDGLRPLRYLLAGGDVLSPTHVQKVQKMLNRCTLINAYGPTENTTFTCCYLVTPQTQIDASVPVGRPIDGTQVYLLDEQLQLVPMGVPGEVYIGGDGLARGYLNQPERTAERFIPNPLGAGRLYKTGDLARFLPDGNLDFMGRTDHQVKIRGFRIEPGEIESVLGQHPEVKHCLVLARSLDSGEKQLVAYWQPQQATFDQSPQRWRQYLQSRLPQYMIPATFVRMLDWPLNNNGKIDHNALLCPSLASSDLDSTAPRNLLEQQLLGLWEDVLGISNISIHDNFFDLGGHSLLAVRLFSNISRSLGQELPLATLFQAPTIAQLAAVIEDAKSPMAGKSVIAISPLNGKTPPFFFHGGAADAVTWERLARQLGSEQPFYALQRPDLAGSEITLIAVEDLARQCIQEIRQIQPTGPYLIGGHCFGGVVAFEIARQLHAQGYEIALLALVDSYGDQPKIPPQISWQQSLCKAQFAVQKAAYYHLRPDNFHKLPAKLVDRAIRP